MSNHNEDLVKELHWEKLGPVNAYSVERLEFVLNQLEDADEFKNGLSGNTEIVDGLTIEELLGGIGEAKHLLETSKEMTKSRNE